MAQKRKRKNLDSITEQMVKYHHYPTPSQFVRHAIRYLIDHVEPLYFHRAEWEHQIRILDHSAGTGVWNAVGAELLPGSYRVNVELQVASPIRPETADLWCYGQRFQEYATEYLVRHAESPAIHPLFDIVWGNFPFKEGESFIHHGYDLLRMGGVMFNLAPINFLSTQERIRTLYRTLTPTRIIHVPKRISFTKDGGTDEKEYVLIVHKKGCIPRFAQVDWHFEWDYDQPDIPEDAVFQGQGETLNQISFLDMWEGVK